MQVSIRMFRNQVPEEVVMRFSRYENVFLVQVETWDDRGGGGERNIGTQPGKKIGPLISSKTYAGSNVGEMGGAYPRMGGAGDFPKNMSMCVRVVCTVPLLDGSNFLQSGTAVRENDKN